MIYRISKSLPEESQELVSLTTSQNFSSFHKDSKEQCCIFNDNTHHPKTSSATIIEKQSSSTFTETGSSKFFQNQVNSLHLKVRETYLKRSYSPGNRAREQLFKQKAASRSSAMRIYLTQGDASYLPCAKGTLLSNTKRTFLRTEKQTSENST